MSNLIELNSDLLIWLVQLVLARTEDGCRGDEVVHERRVEHEPLNGGRMEKTNLNLVVVVMVARDRR